MKALEKAGGTWGPHLAESLSESTEEGVIRRFIDEILRLTPGHENMKYTKSLMTVRVHDLGPTGEADCLVYNKVSPFQPQIVSIQCL